MRILRWALFSADLPDDGVESETDILVYLGRNVAEAIGGLLRGLGYEVSEPEDQEENGWDFDYHASGRRFWCQVSGYEEKFSLVTEDMARTWTDKVFKRPHHPIYAEVLTRLNEAFAADPRFHEVQWFSDEDFGTGEPGAASPVSDD